MNCTSQKEVQASSVSLRNPLYIRAVGVCVCMCACIELLYHVAYSKGDDVNMFRYNGQIVSKEEQYLKVQKV